MKITRSVLKQLIKEQMTLLQEDESQTTLSGAKVPQYMFDGMERADALAVMRSMGRGSGRHTFGPIRWKNGGSHSGHTVNVEGLEELAPKLNRYANYDEPHWSETKRDKNREDSAVGFSIQFYVGSEEWTQRFGSGDIDPNADKTAYVTAELKTRSSSEVEREVNELYLNDFNAQNGGKGAKIMVDGKSDLPFTLSWEWLYRSQFSG